MLEMKATARKWGNSLGIALPKHIVEMAQIKPNKEFRVFIQDKAVDLTKMYGTLEISKPTQELLDEIREGEE